MKSRATPQEQGSSSGFSGIAEISSLRGGAEEHLFKECPSLRLLSEIKHGWNILFPMIPSAYHWKFLIKNDFLLEQEFCFSKRLAIGRGKVLLGNMPSKYTRNFLRVLYFPKN